MWQNTGCNSFTNNITPAVKSDYSLELVIQHGSNSHTLGRKISRDSPMTPYNSIKSIFVLLTFCFALPALADGDAITNQFKKSFPQISLSKVEETAVKGIYRVVTSSGELLYSSADGKHLFTGDLLRLEATGPVNVTEKWRGAQRVESLKSLKDKDLVVYPAKGDEKSEVLVFTDTSCGYCRKFHSEIPAMNAKGITVKYVAWPRQGVQSQAGQTMTNVWCSENRESAMDLAKTNRPVDPPGVKVCDQNVLQDQINLGHRIGVRGTPAVFTLTGRQIGGYVKADKLASELGIQ